MLICSNEHSGSDGFDFCFWLIVKWSDSGESRSAVSSQGIFDGVRRVIPYSQETVFGIKGGERRAHRSQVWSVVNRQEIICESGL
jgi:hypothetical protein